MTIAEAKGFVAALKGSVAEMDKLAKHVNDGMLSGLVRAQRNLARRVERFIAEAPALSEMSAQARLAWYGAEGRRFATIVRESGFYSLAQAHLGAFEEMARMSELALMSGGVPTAWANVPKDFIKALQGREMHRFAFFGTEAANKLDDTFMSLMLSGAGRGKMLAELRSVITGEYAWGSRKGLYEWHAGTYVRTSTHRHMQSFMNQQAQEAGLENFLYLGPYDTKTRPFCQPLVGQVLRRSEIEELDNGQSGDAMSDGGGWNCRHEWVAVLDDLAEKMRENPDTLGKDKVKDIKPKYPKGKVKMPTKIKFHPKSKLSQHPMTQKKLAEIKAAKAAKKQAEFLEPWRENAGPSLEWGETLTARQMKGIDRWIISEWGDFRAIDMGRKASRPSQYFYNGFKSATLKAPNYRGTVYRGMHDLSDDALRAFKTNKTMKFDAFSSASKSKLEAEHFCRGKYPSGNSVLLEIKTKQGVDLAGYYERSGASMKSEAEVILRKSERFRVISRTMHQTTLGPESEYEMKYLHVLMEAI